MRVADDASMSKPLLRLPDSPHDRTRFHTELVEVLKAAGCTQFVPEQCDELHVAHENLHAGDAPRLKAVCDEVARFHRGDETEVGMPDGEAATLFSASAALGMLPYRWEQVLRFLRASALPSRDAAERMFPEFATWCAAQDEGADVDEHLYVTAVRDSWARLDP